MILGQLDEEVDDCCWAPNNNNQIINTFFINCVNKHSIINVVPYIEVHRITMQNYKLKLIKVFHYVVPRDFQMIFINLKCLQRQKAKMGEEEACCLELLRRWRGFAVSLWVREMLGSPDFFTVPLQSVLILYLLGHQSTKSVVLNFQLKRER